MQTLIASIIDLEWESFQAVHGSHGRAPCQDNHATFIQMRASQFLAWTEELCTLYLANLQQAKAMGRNLLAEKYARMMAATAPKEYERIQDMLPPVCQEAESLVDTAVAFHVVWRQQSAARYPHLAARSRPVQETSGNDDDTSFTTYLRGELLTYSLELLYAYVAYVRELYTQNSNLHNTILEHTVKLGGYASLDDAEQAFASSRQ